MKHPPAKTLLNILLRLAGLLGLLAAGAGEAYLRFSAFQGELCASKNAPERIAIQITGAEYNFTPLRNWRRAHQYLQTLPIYRNFHPEEIPFENKNAAELLDAAKTYNYIRLPFKIELKRTAVLEQTPPTCRLKQTGPGGELKKIIETGGKIEIGEKQFTVKTLRKWGGLLRNPKGSPMAAVSLRQPGQPWTENVFLPSGLWQRIEPEGALYFEWFDSQEAAGEAMATGQPARDSARWGVVEGDALHWFESFAPGTGITLGDGTSVVLLQLEENPQDSGAAIKVQIEKNGQSSTIWVAANEKKKNEWVRFDYPALLDPALVLYGCPGGGVAVGVYRKKQKAVIKMLHTGKTWKGEGIPFELRLDQVLDRAVPVKPEDSPLYEAVLVSGDEELRLREGEAIRHNDILLEFTRTQPPPVLRYDLLLTGENGQTTPFSVPPGKEVRIRDWRVAQAPPAHNPTQKAVLHLEQIPNRTAIKLILAASLAVLLFSVINPRRPD